MLLVFGELDRHLVKVKTSTQAGGFGLRGGHGTNHSITLDYHVQAKHCG